MTLKQPSVVSLAAAVLAITGCGDSGGSDNGGGSGGSGGSGGTAGAGGTAGSAGNAGSNGGGSSASTCEAICNSSCTIGGVAPGDEVAQCISQCKTVASMWDDNCGPQMDTLLDCIESKDCDPDNTDCRSQALAWLRCWNPAIP